MRRTSRLLVVFGIGLAVLTFVLIVALLPSSGNGGLAPGATPTLSPNVTVVVAAKDVPLGTQITAAMVSTTSVPRDQATPGAFADVSLVIGQVARQKILSGQQVSAADFATEQTTISVPPGKRAMAIEVNELSGVGNLIFPGDYVDVIITLDQRAIKVVSTGAGNTTTTPAVHDDSLAPVTVKASALLQDIQVLGTLAAPVAAPAAGASPQPSQGPAFNGQPVGKLLILAVDDNQAEAILFARSFGTANADNQGTGFGTIDVVLRSLADASAPPVNTSGVDLKTMFSRYGVLPPFLAKEIDAFIAQQP